MLGAGAGEPMPVEPELELPDPMLPDDELEPVLGVLGVLGLEPMLLPVLPEPLVLP